MKRNQKWIIGIGTSLALGIAAMAVSAHPGQMGAGAQGGPHQFSKSGMGHGAMRHGGTGPQAAQQLMTPEERTAMREKMRAAKTLEERQQIAAATRTELQKRAAERGVTLPEGRGPRGRFGPSPAATPATPSTGEHVH